MEEAEWNKYRIKPAEERIQKADEIYSVICCWYKAFISSEEGRKGIGKFNDVLPTYKDRVSNVKKIDYLLWSKRQ